MVGIPRPPWEEAALRPAAGPAVIRLSQRETPWELEWMEPRLAALAGTQRSEWAGRWPLRLSWLAAPEGRAVSQPRQRQSAV